MPSRTALAFIAAALSGFLGLFASTAPVFAVSVKTIYTFCSLANCADGTYASGGVIFDSAGNLYGTTYFGGTGQSCPISEGGCGVVYELTPSDGKWTERVLNSFCSLNNCTDGEMPSGTLVFDKAGNLYGITERGGAYGLGTIFELIHGNGDWTEKVLYSFGVNSTDAASPVAIIFGKDGNLYGTTVSGGSGQFCLGGCGTVFELIHRNGQWTEKILHNFAHNGQDGFAPYAGVIFDSKGNLYGSTNGGGADNRSGCNGYGCGTVFELSPGKNGQWTEEILHSFYNDGIDGANPDTGEVIFDRVGNLYGTTEFGGADSNGCGLFGCGTVFELSPEANGQWSEKILHSFYDNGTDGTGPDSLIVGAHALYGTTGSGGAFISGTIFELTPSNGQWAENVLYTFTDSGTDGARPSGSIARDKAGNAYGTTTQGGPLNRSGVVYEVTP